MTQKPIRLFVRQIIDAYLAQKHVEAQKGVYSAQSLDRARHYLNSFAAEYGQQSVEDCKASDPANWILGHPEWKSPHTQLDAVGAVVTCFNWARDEPLIERSPYRRKKTTWESPSPRQAIEPGEYREIMRLAAACDGKGRRARPSRFAFRRQLWFLWHTGSRTCEARECRWEQVDFNRRTITLQKHKTAKATGEARVIPLRRVVVRYLRYLWEQRGRPRAGLIFLNGRGRAWTKGTYGKMFKKYASMAGVRPVITAYCLRHGFCCRALERGIGERQVADALGHTTTRYVAWYGKSLRTKSDYLTSVVDQF